MRSPAGKYLLYLIGTVLIVGGAGAVVWSSVIAATVGGDEGSVTTPGTGDGGDGETSTSTQKRWDFQVATDSGFTDIKVDRRSCNMDAPDGTPNEQTVEVVNMPDGTQVYCSGTSEEITSSPDQLTYNTSYYWRVRVWDQDGDTSGWIPYDEDGDGNPDSFETARHAWPSPDFSYSPDRPLIDEEIDFSDESTCYNVAGNETSCSGNNYTWDFDDGETSSQSGDVTHTYTDSGTYNVTLSIESTDPGIGMCTYSQSVPVSRSSPRYREIAP